MIHAGLCRSLAGNLMNDGCTLLVPASGRHYR